MWVKRCWSEFSYQYSTPFALCYRLQLIDELSYEDVKKCYRGSVSHILRLWVVFCRCPFFIWFWSTIKKAILMLSKTFIYIAIDSNNNVTAEALEKRFIACWSRKDARQGSRLSLLKTSHCSVYWTLHSERCRCFWPWDVIKSRNWWLPGNMITIINVQCHNYNCITSQRPDLWCCATTWVKHWETFLLTEFHSLKSIRIMMVI